jgi:hypothetical protein
MNVLYFANVIPPIPLSLKSAGVYHGITKISGGNYQAQAEPRVWQDYFNRFPVFHRQAGETIYVFSAIFSPVNFATQITHQWQYYDEAKREWVDSSRIDLPITGGRADGFRTYSVKSNFTPASGRWRVRVMTIQGQVVGNINFTIENEVGPRGTYPQLLN